MSKNRWKSKKSKQVTAQNISKSTPLRPKSDSIYWKFNLFSIHIIFNIMRVYRMITAKIGPQNNRYFTFFLVVPVYGSLWRHFALNRHKTRYYYRKWTYLVENMRFLKFRVIWGELQLKKLIFTKKLSFFALFWSLNIYRGQLTTYI